MSALSAVTSAAASRREIAATETAVQAAARKAFAPLRDQVVAGVKAGRRERVYVDVGGAVMRGVVVSADASSVVVRLRQGEIPIPWKALSARRFAGIAAKFASRSTPDRVQLAALFAAAGEREQARKILDALGPISGQAEGLAEQIRMLVRSR